MSDPFEGLKVLAEEDAEEDPLAGLPDLSADAGVPAGVPDEPEPEPMLSEELPEPEYDAPDVAPKPERPWYESLWRGVGQGTTLGYGDELQASISSGFGSHDVDRTVGRGMTAPRETRSTYEIDRDARRKENTTAQEANPLWYLAGEVTGGALTAAVPVLNTAKMPVISAWTPAARNLAVAAGGGTVAGHGFSDAESFSDQAWDTFGGGVLSGFGSLVGSAGQAGFRKVTDGTQGVIARMRAAHGEEAAEKLRMGLDPKSKQGRELRKLQHAGESPERLDYLAKSIGERMSKIAKHGDDIHAEETIAKKQAVARAYFARDQIDPGEASEYADSIAFNLELDVEEMLQHAVPGTDDYRLLDRFVPFFKEYNHLPPATRELGGNFSNAYDVVAEKWARLDQLKRDIQRTLRNVKFNSRDVESLHAIEERLRQELERPDIFGQGASELQRKRNQAWSDLLSLEQTKDINPRREFMTDHRGIRSANEHNYRPLPEGDQAAIRGVLERAGTLEGEDALWKLGEVATRRAQLGDVLSDHILANPDFREKAFQQRMFAQGVNLATKRRQAEALAANEFRTLERNLPPPSRSQKAMDWVARRFDIADLEATGRPIERMRQLGQLEHQAAEHGIKRELALRHADGRWNRFWENHRFDKGAHSQHAINAMIPGNSDAHGRAMTMAGQYGGDILRELTGNSRGHETDERVKQVLASDPSLLGAYADSLRKADQEGRLAAELYRLEADTEWRTKVLPQILMAR